MGWPGAGNATAPFTRMDGHFRLRAREGKSKSVLAREQWAQRERVEHTDEACVIERGRLLMQGKRGWHFARRQKLERARHVASEAIEKGEIIAARDAERLGRRVPLALFGKETAEERSALATAEWLLAFRQGGRQRRSIDTLEPIGRIGEAEFAVLVLSELANEPPVPPDIEDANRHRVRPSLGPDGGVISKEHPRALKTCSVFPI